MVRRLGIAVAALILAGACTAILDVPDVTLSHATCTDGKCVCEEHFTHCVAASKDPCETDLHTSSAHCGTCGHDCLGGACEGGVCQPLVIDQVAGARGLVAFGGEVYVGVCSDPDVDAGDTRVAFLRLRFDGKPLEPAVHAAFCGELPIVAEGRLFWSGSRDVGDGALLSTPIPLQSASPPLTHVVDGTLAVGLAATAANIYWRELFFEPPGTWKDTGLWWAPLDTGVKSRIVEESLSVAAVGQAVYWSSPKGSPLDTGIFQRPEGSGQTEQISTLAAINLAINSTHLYFWVKGDGIYALPIPVLDAANPPAPTLVAPGVNSMGAIRADETALYWIENVEGRVMMLDLVAGGPPRAMVTQTGFGGVARLAADEKAIYFIGDSQVGRVAK